MFNDSLIRELVIYSITRFTYTLWICLIFLSYVYVIFENSISNLYPFDIYLIYTLKS